MTTTKQQNEKVWFVTGASKGLGADLVQRLLAEGYKVAATSRKKQSMVDLIGEHENFLPLTMDVTSNHDVKKAIDQVVDKFGSIDIVVNNAGYSQIGAIEELTDAEVKNNFNVNVFGPLNVIRNAAPYLRKQRAGHIFNIASIGGFVGDFAAFGIYCSTKFAMAGYTEALAVEMQPFGVHTTLVYPGYFRTTFLDKDSVMVPASPIEAYANAREVEAQHLKEINGNQPNDPKKAAEVFIELSKQETPPVHFFMGIDAAALVNSKVRTIELALANNLKLTESTAITE
ncbi:short-chain dehydrogenase/reductase SDR [Pedobacter sp. BAL39]|uniref:SDR family oxidoreductase n=1 Tax=Pedobacter sp. BAL39 TaxID=391596 RepID=UPI000155980F|nr:SDR family oxidoreductase [Pedobacter sp. BAL39]EDM36939.1 short-chain dehydrogenase/reductase SDR [Pedobacter sp. BAL39]